MTPPQDFGCRSQLFIEEPIAFIGKPLSLICQSLALIGGTISFFCATRSLVKLAPQLLKARSVGCYCFRFSTALNHASACE